MVSHGTDSIFFTFVKGMYGLEGGRDTTEEESSL